MRNPALALTPSPKCECAPAQKDAIRLAAFSLGQAIKAAGQKCLEASEEIQLVVDFRLYSR